MIYKRIIPLSLAVVANSEQMRLKVPQVSVESTVITEVSQNAQVSADLAEALKSTIQLLI